jgi:hypothetical protein
VFTRRRGASIGGNVIGKRRAAALILFVATAATAQAQLLTAARQVEPVVLTGAQLPAWSRLPSLAVCAPYPSGTTGGRDAHNGTTVVPPDLRTGVAVDQIVAYRWTGLQYVEIPVQVDQRYHYCLSNPPSGFSFYSGTDKELTYEWDVESWKKTAGQCSAAYPPGAGPTPDPVPALDDDDEIVFMASDAGVQAPLGALPPLGTLGGQAVTLVDPLDPGTLRYVYLFLKLGGSSFDASNGYVSYVRDADADEWIDQYSIARDDPEILGVSNTDYGPNLSGTVCRTATYPGYPSSPDGTPRASTDRFVRDGVTVSTDTYRWRATGRWMVRDIRVAKAGQPGVYGPDLIDRWKGRAFQQSPDSTISLVGFEDEQVNWEANSATLGERAGAVRAIREVWGADSGTNVTKTETFYRDAVAYRYHVRVHPIPPDGLYTSWDYNAGVAGTYYNILKPNGVAIDGINDDVGSVDGVFGFPAYFDAPDPTFNAPSAILNWEQIAGRNDFGSLVYIVEIKGATTLVNPAVVPYYRDDKCLDDGTGDNPIPRPWPGEASTDPRVRDGYSAENGGVPYPNLTCNQKQGAWGAHGIHYFVTADSDNAASPEVLTEIDAQQWQFMVPQQAPSNVGQRYGNVVAVPLVAVGLPLNGLPTLLAPSAGSGTGTTAYEIPVTLTLSGSDLLTCDLTFSVVSGPSHGSVGAITNRPCRLGLSSSDTASITYTPAAGFSGTDSFTYKVNDGLNDSNIATMTIHVGPPPPVLCANGPVSPCRGPSNPRKASFLIRDDVLEIRDHLRFRWRESPPIPVEEFGDPLRTSTYQLCVYDASGRTIARVAAPPGGDCGNRPCWRQIAERFKYRSRDKTPEGAPRSSLKLTLSTGESDGKSSIIARARGVHLDLVPLPAAQPLRVQLKNSEGFCWEGTFSAPASVNRTDRFSDKSD